MFLVFLSKATQKSLLFLVTFLPYSHEGNAKKAIPDVGMAFLFIFGRAQPSLYPVTASRQCPLPIFPLNINNLASI